MIKEALQYLIEQGGKLSDETYEPVFFEDGPRKYTYNCNNETLTPLPPPVAAPIEVVTLQGLVDYINSAIPEGPMALYIRSAVAVEVIDRFPSVDWARRCTHARAGATIPQLRIDTALPVEMMIIHLQTAFAQNNDRDALLKALGNLRAEQTLTVEDDGVTQRAQMRAGVARVAEAPIPSPILLAPYRSFPEITPEISPFVVRISGGTDGKPLTAALFSVGDVGWIARTQKQIAAWLRVAGVDLPIIG